MWVNVTKDKRDWIPACRGLVSVALSTLRAIRPITSSHTQPPFKIHECYAKLGHQSWLQGVSVRVTMMKVFYVAVFTLVILGWADAQKKRKSKDPTPEDENAGAVRAFSQHQNADAFSFLLDLRRKQGLSSIWSSGMQKVERGWQSSLRVNLQGRLLHQESCKCDECS